MAIEMGGAVGNMIETTTEQETPMSSKKCVGEMVSYFGRGLRMNFHLTNHFVFFVEILCIDVKMTTKCVGKQNDMDLSINDADEKTNSEDELKIVNCPWTKGWKVTSVMENEENNIHIDFCKKMGKHTATLVPGK